MNSPTSKPVIIAIDGPSGSGKSTTARETARRMGFIHVDTGGMYRVVTWAVLKRGIKPDDESAVAAILPSIKFEGRVKDGSVDWWVDGYHPEKEIRSPEVTTAVSPVSAMRSVREWCVARQRETAKLGNLVMEGRDIGTVVFPGTPYKFFLNASAEVRARRRQRDLAALDFKQSVDQVAQSILERDRKDSSRAHSPLRKADDAVEIDTSDQTVERTAAIIVADVRARMGAS